MKRNILFTNANNDKHYREICVQLRFFLETIATIRFTVDSSERSDKIVGEKISAGGR